jgi:hypothetical protein
MDNMDVKEEGDGEPDGMDDEDMLEDDPKDDNPEESEIREMRNRLEPLYLIWINGCLLKNLLGFPQPGFENPHVTTAQEDLGLQRQMPCHQGADLGL